MPLDDIAFRRFKKRANNAKIRDPLLTMVLEHIEWAHRRILSLENDNNQLSIQLARISNRDGQN